MMFVSVEYVNVIVHVFQGKQSFPSHQHADGSNKQYSPQCKRMGQLLKLLPPTSDWHGWVPSGIPGCNSGIAGKRICREKNQTTNQQNPQEENNLIFPRCTVTLWEMLHKGLLDTKACLSFLSTWFLGVGQDAMGWCGWYGTGSLL